MLSSKQISGETVNGFSAWTHPMSNGQELLLRLHCPETYPLVVHFHGKGSCENDNLAQLRFAQLLLEPEINRKKCFIFAPQCSTEMLWVNTDFGTLPHSLPSQVTPAWSPQLLHSTTSLRQYAGMDENRITPNLRKLVTTPEITPIQKNFLNGYSHNVKINHKWKGYDSDSSMNIAKKG
ncbi:MAG: hypothetical protein WCV67_14205 [Victivallaceae bacterium]|jgi:hypothetical protein